MVTADLYRAFLAYFQGPGGGPGQGKVEGLTVRVERQGGQFSEQAEHGCGLIHS